MARARVSNGRNSGKGDLGFEATLWQAADKLRGNLDSGEYKHVVLGLIFLKYISDAFEEKRSALLQDPRRTPRSATSTSPGFAYIQPPRADALQPAHEAHLRIATWYTEASVEVKSPEDLTLKGEQEKLALAFG